MITKLLEQGLLTRKELEKGGRAHKRLKSNLLFLTLQLALLYIQELYFSTGAVGLGQLLMALQS